MHFSRPVLVWLRESFVFFPSVKYWQVTAWFSWTRLSKSINISTGSSLVYTTCIGSREWTLHFKSIFRLDFYSHLQSYSSSINIPVVTLTVLDSSLWLPSHPPQICESLGTLCPSLPSPSRTNKALAQSDLALAFPLLASHVKAERAWQAPLHASVLSAPHIRVSLCTVTLGSSWRDSPFPRRQDVTRPFELRVHSKQSRQ